MPFSLLPPPRCSVSNELLPSLLGPNVDPVDAGVTLQRIAADEAVTGAQLLTALMEGLGSLKDSDPAILAAVFRLMHTRFLVGDREELNVVQPDQIGQLIDAIPTSTPNVHLLLQMLTLQASDSSLELLFKRLPDCAPEGWVEAGQILSPLMQRKGWNVDVVFPAALDGLASPSLASPILDLANYLTRQQQVHRHPAADRITVLNHLLGEVASRLAKFEEDPHSFGDDVPTVQKRLGEAVALAVSLCDAVGLIGDESSIGKLNQAVELRHRRVQCEAAGALAMLDQASGRDRLIELSADPAARLRAIQYADEMGFGDKIDDQYRTDQATAESELALWLTQPQQMGVPPTAIEVLESRRMIWPSFTDPIDVFLVRFEYNFGESLFSNVGIAGPVAFALAADVADLPQDDIYAIYAGWHVDHDEIFTVPANQLNDAQRRIVETFQVHLDRLGYEDVKNELLGFFLDETAGVFEATRNGKPCVVVTDGLETIDQPTAGRMRPLQSSDLFNLYKGRKMLRTFNS